MEKVLLDLVFFALTNGSHSNHTSYGNHSYSNHTTGNYSDDHFVHTDDHYAHHDDHYTSHSADDHHGSDDHASGHATNGSHHSGSHELVLFGLVYQEDIHIPTYAAMMAIIIASVIAVDLLFHLLVVMTDDTPFAEMIHAIEKELMTVGVTAFMFKIIINSSNVLYGDYLHALEFADTLVPVYSFCNCFLGLILVFLSMKQSDLWSKAFHMRLDEMLDEFFEKSASLWYRLVPSAFSSLNAELEFRIFHNIFCEMFNIHTAAIAFDEYVNCVAEKYVFSIIEISPLNWLLFGFIAIFDYARVDYTVYFAGCDHHDKECVEYYSVVIFVILGSILYFVCFVFAIFSRFYLTMMIRMKGITNIKMYPAFLQYFEHQLETSAEKRMNEDDLQRAVNEAKAKRSANANVKKRGLGGLLGGHGHGHGGGSFTIFHVSESNKQVAKVSPDAVFQVFKSNLTAAPAGGSEKMDNNGKPPKFKKKKAPSIEDEVETFNQTGQLVTYAAQEREPKVCRLSVAELSAIVNIQAANDKDIEEAEVSRKLEANKSGGSFHLGNALRQLRKSILLMPGAKVQQDEEVPVADVEMGSVRQPGMGAGLGARASVAEGSNENSQHSGRSVVTPRAVVDVNGEQKGSEEHEEEEDEASALVQTKPSSPLKMKLVSFDASVPAEMSAFQSKKEASFSVQRTAQQSPIQRAITDAMNAAGIAHVATEMEDGTVELSVVHTSPTNRAFESTLLQHHEKMAEEEEREEAGDSDRPSLVTAPSAKEEATQPPVEVAPAAVVATSTSTHGSTHGSSGHHSSREAAHRSTVSSVFLFSRPELYFESSQIIMIFISVYLAIWLIYMVPSSIHGGWKVLTLLPGVMSFLTYTYIVRVACFLKAIFQIDNEAMLEVVEQTESSKILKKTIISKLHERLQAMGDEQAMIFQLFREIDADDDNALSRQEFATYLNSLDIFFSRKKWNQVFRDICIYRNSKVSFDEFSLFLYPDHGVVLAQEKKRLNKLKHRVSLKSIELVKKVNRNEK